MLRRVSLFVVTNLAIVLVLGVVLGALSAAGLFEGIDEYYVSLLVMAAVLGFGGSLLSLAISKWVAKRATGARVIETPRDEREAWLLSVVSSLAARRGLRTPEVAIYDSPEMNAFATGPTRNRSLVAVSTGLLAGMRRDEVEAVIGHELSHVQNGDMVTLMMIQGVLNTFVIFGARLIGEVVDKAVFRTERGRGPGYWVSVIVAQVVLGVLATAIVMWFSRRREFRADAGAAELVGAPGMIAALRRLGGSRGSELPDSLRAFGIRGGPGRGLASLFRSHPPLEERIARLSAASGRSPEPGARSLTPRRAAP